MTCSNYRPILFQNLTYQYTHKVCLENFSRSVPHGKKIGIVGKNGQGKTTFLKIIYGELIPNNGHLEIPQEYGEVFFIQQLIENHENLSGAQKFNVCFSQALSCSPHILLLDEPTNHLDRDNRQSLMRNLKKMNCNLFIASHDEKFLDDVTDEIWFLDEGKVEIFSGKLGDFYQQLEVKERQTSEKIQLLNKQKKKAFERHLQEEARAVKAKKYHKNENDVNLLGLYREGGSKTASKNQGKINQFRKETTQLRSELKQVEKINCKFYFNENEVRDSIPLIEIRRGLIKLGEKNLGPIDLDLFSGERLLIKGKNASGKTTLVKALLGHAQVERSGHWYLVDKTKVSFVDQHYQNLHDEKNVFDHLYEAAPNQSDQEIRKILNDFLFRKNEEVFNQVKNLSGGEKCRLSLALIAVQRPKLVILDEVTNNLDKETKNHLVDVVKAFSGALVMISHDEEFLNECLRVGPGVDFRTIFLS